MVSGSDVGWRAEDAVLLESLRDEVAVDTLYAFMTPNGSPPLPRRAAVLVRHARALPGGAAAALAARHGSPAELATLLSSARLRELPPELLHACAVFFDRVGRAQLPLAFNGDNARKANDAFMRSLAAWLLLEHEPSYLRELAAVVADGVLDASELEREAVSVARASANELCREAERGMKGAAPGARVALHVLGRIGEACRLAELEATVANRVVARTERMRARVIDDALTPLGEALDDARGRHAALDEAPRTFERIAELWQLADRDEAVERFAVERLVPIAWDAYLDREWPKLRKLLAPCTPLADSLEARILAHPADHLAYSAHVAQMLMFRSDVTEQKDEIPLLERAVKVCPAHRNSRNSLAHYLCERAKQRLAGANIFSARTDILEAVRLVDRAESVFDQSKRIPELRAAIDEAKKRFGTFS
jgi:hypothetical protein